MLKAYTLGRPPNTPGIYRLVHKPSSHVYVGQSLDLARRYNEWRAGAALGFGHLNMEMDKALKQYPALEEWYFVVMKELPGSTAQQLRAEEELEIDVVRNSTFFKLLNTPMASKMVALTPGAPVRIVAKDGTALGQRAAARLLGRYPDTIRDKVRWLRGQGVGEVALEDLLLDRRDILQKFQNP